MVVKNTLIIDFFKLKPRGGKGWYSGTCPYCKAKNKFGIKFDENTFASFNCFSGSCQRRGSIYDLLKDFDKLEFITLKKDVDIHKPLEESLKEDILDLRDEKTTFEEIDTKRLPMGYRRVYSNNYLEEERGWGEEDFLRYEVGMTKLDPKLKNRYVIFPVTMNKEVKGFFSRVMMSKEEAEREGLLRWINSDADFGRLLYGIDEIKEATETIILVEGLFAKKATDKVLEKYDLSENICLVSFGKKISDDQIKLIKYKAPRIRRFIFFYDFDAVNAIKNESGRISREFEEILVAPILIKGKDPDDLSEKELFLSLTNLISIQEFMIDKLQENQLRV